MATIEKRGDLQWRVKIRHRNYPPQSKTFSRRADAKAWARETESKMERGIFVDRSEAERTPLSEALERYRKEVSGNKKGFQQERSIINNINASSLARLSIAYISGGDIADYRDERLCKVGKKQSGMN